MYVAVVLFTMLLLPGLSVGIEHALHPQMPLLPLIGRWFVFWGVGVRLGLAGLRQVLQPAFTAREIFHMEGVEALPLVRELGVANLGAAVLGLASVAAPTFVLPAAIWAALFYGVAGATHVAERARSRNESIAMISDIFMALLLAIFVACTLLRLC